MKHLYTLMLLATVSCIVYGQNEERLRIVFNDDSRSEWAVTSIKYVDFVNRPSVYTSCPEGTVAEAIDLGLSVRWASWNVGANKPSEFGGYFGWADPTGNVTSKSVDDYRTDLTDIAGTQWDGATAKWGSQWRIPTQAQWQELIDNCRWQFCEQDGEAGWKITGSTGNSIFLPLTFYRYGNAYPTTFNSAEYRLSDTYEAYFYAYRDYYEVSTYWPEAYEGMPIRAICDDVQKPYFDISPTEVEFDADAGTTATLIVDTNCDWQLISGQPSWLTVSPTSGNASYTNVTITATENTITEPRTATLRFGNATVSTTVTIVQKGKTQTSTLFELPYMEWGASESTVRQNMNTYTLTDQGTNNSGDRYLLYDGKWREYATIMFLNSEYGLWSARTVISTSAATIDEIHENLSEIFLLDHINDDGSRVYGKINYATMKIETMVYLYESTSSSFYYIDYESYEFTHKEEPMPVLFDDPYLSWGTSRSDVRSYMQNNGYTLLEESLLASNGYSLIYDGRQKEVMSAYYFDSSRKLMQVNVVLLADVADKNDVGTFLKNNMNYLFIYTTSDGTTDAFLSEDMATVAYVTPTTISSTEAIIVTFYDINIIYSSVKVQRHAALNKHDIATALEQQRPMPLPQQLKDRIILSKALKASKWDAPQRSNDLKDMPRLEIMK